MPIFVTLGVLLSIDHGITIVMKTLYMSILVCLLNSLHLINSNQGAGISEYLKISNFGQNGTFPESKISTFWKRGVQSPFYVPWKFSQNEILFPDQIQMISLYKHWFCYLLILALYANRRLRTYCEKLFGEWRSKYGDDFFIMGKDPNASKYKYNRAMLNKNYPDGSDQEYV
jgi:hypothetical protein